MTQGALLPIYETFYAWQGEGCHMGRAAYFIRTFGCPVKCPWCDSAGTWHPDWVPEKIDRIAPDVLATRAAAQKAEFVVITGGEPTIHDLTSLTSALRKQGLPSHLETSGSFEIRGDFAWVTVSPKWAKLPLPENVRRANEIKLIVEDAASINKWLDQLAPHLSDQVIWLHPEWSRREDSAVLNAISTAVKKHGHPLRAGYQIHRLYNVDCLDLGARRNIPLGGDVRMGY